MITLLILRFLSKELDNGENHDDAEQYEGRCAGITEAIVRERSLVDKIGQHVRGSSRSPLGHCHDDIEHLAGADHLIDQDEENRR